MPSPFDRRPARGTLAASAVLQPIPGVLRLSDLAGADGAARPSGRDLAGQVITLHGYLAPMPRPQVFLLTDDTQAPCQTCGSLHQGGPSLLVHAADQVLRTIPMHVAAAVSGRLALGDGQGSVPGSVPGSFQAPELLLLDAHGHVLRPEPPMP